ncbi:MAG: DUF1800 domain-containing protein [Acidobacteria bacterium]|nr:DUF1800 domain-containing protein [Acidobacteriota bacterium]
MTTRRQFLKLFGLAAIGVGASGCQVAEKLAPLVGIGRDFTAQLPIWTGSRAEIDALNFLNRVTWGVRPKDVPAVVQSGFEAYLEQQLSPESIPDDKAHWLTRRIETLNLGVTGVFHFTAEELLLDLRRATVLRAVYSERQLLERMVEFWSDHFNIHGQKGSCGQLKVVDDREVIRRHALGNFRDLLRASATSPAMLVYLDGNANVAAHPNENYARELLELHTLGVSGGYSQHDVQEVARVLTGWKVKDGLRRGQVVLNSEFHDSQPKQVLGQIVGGEATSELEQVLDLVCRHPSTASFLAQKLCRRFVSDEPSDTLVRRVAEVFTQTGGDIRSMVRVIFSSTEFRQFQPRFKRPLTYAMSALRLLNAECDGGRGIQRQLESLGHLPFAWPTPDGYPEGESHWASSLLPRWNFACALPSGTIDGTRVDLDQLGDQVFLHLPYAVGRTLTAAESDAFSKLDSPAEQLALLLCMPEFQYQ